jgi:hypothetical protein
MNTSAIVTIGLLGIWCSLCADDKDKSDQRMLGYALGFGLLFILVCKNLYSEEEEDEECSIYEYVTNEPANEPANEPDPTWEEAQRLGWTDKEAYNRRIAELRRLDAERRRITAARQPRASKSGSLDWLGWVSIIIIVIAVVAVTLRGLC